MNSIRRVEDLGNFVLGSVIIDKVIYHASQFWRKRKETADRVHLRTVGGFMVGRSKESVESI